MVYHSVVLIVLITGAQTRRLHSAQEFPPSSRRQLASSSPEMLPEACLQLAVPLSANNRPNRASLRAPPMTKAGLGMPPCFLVGCRSNAVAPGPVLDADRAGRDGKRQRNRAPGMKQAVPAWQRLLARTKGDRSSTSDDPGRPAAARNK